MLQPHQLCVPHRVLYSAARTHWNALCRRYMRPLDMTMLVLDLRSCVELVTLAHTCGAPQMMIKLLFHFAGCHPGQ